MYAEHRRPLAAFAAVSCACALMIGNATGVSLISAGSDHEDTHSQLVVATRSPHAGDASLAQQAIHGSQQLRSARPSGTPTSAPITVVGLDSGDPSVPQTKNANSGGTGGSGSTEQGNSPVPSPSSTLPGAPETSPAPPVESGSASPGTDEDGALTFDGVIKPGDSGDDTSPSPGGENTQDQNPATTPDSFTQVVEPSSVNAVGADGSGGSGSGADASERVVPDGSTAETPAAETPAAESQAATPSGS